MKNKQTAVEWLVNILLHKVQLTEIEKMYVEQAKEMEKQQGYSEEDLRQAFRDGQSNMHYSDNFGLDSSLTEQQWFEQFKKI